MQDLRRSRLARAAVLASGAMLLLGGTALAQTVRVFDDAPSIEQLRRIMIPESVPGVGRTIVIQHPDMSAMPSPVQHATARLPAEPVPAAENPAYHTAAASVAPAPKPQPEPAAASPRTPDAAPAAIGFRINFAFDSAALPSAADGMIDRIAELMKEAPQIRLRVEGHTDATGSAEYNEALSERRALSVAEYLVRHGIEPGRLIVVGKGMKEPLGEDRFAPANRRVQFVRIG